jgi:hypothetical protein
LRRPVAYRPPPAPPLELPLELPLDPDEPDDELPAPEAPADPAPPDAPALPPDVPAAPELLPLDPAPAGGAIDPAPVPLLPTDPRPAAPPLPVPPMSDDPVLPVPTPVPVEPDPLIELDPLAPTEGCPVDRPPAVTAPLVSVALPEVIPWRLISDDRVPPMSGAPLAGGLFRFGEPLRPPVAVRSPGTGSVVGLLPRPGVPTPLIDPVPRVGFVRSVLPVPGPVPTPDGVDDVGAPAPEMSLDPLAPIPDEPVPLPTPDDPDDELPPEIDDPDELPL